MPQTHSQTLKALALNTKQKIVKEKKTPSDA